jgi:hypothetical protein
VVIYDSSSGQGGYSGLKVLNPEAKHFHGVGKGDHELDPRSLPQAPAFG